MNADLTRVPVISVFKDNFVTVWPSLILAIDTAHWIGIDVELSGLGDRKLLITRNIEDRYLALAEIAKSRSILSLGLACFRLQTIVDSVIKTENAESLSLKPPEATETSSSYTVQIFDLSLLCMDDYVVEPLSLQFLVNHGFDFNKQCSQGLPYHRGNNEEVKVSDKPSVRKLFTHLIASNKKLVLHNGFVDLVFLYQNLYAELPSKLAVFSADLEEMFSGGIFDTKYVAEFCLHYKASYLEYVFKRIQRLNNDHQSSFKHHTRISFLHFNNFEYIDFDDLRSIRKTKNDIELCVNFASHGWCSNPSNCLKSHDVDLVLNGEDAMKQTRKKRKAKKRATKPSRENEMELDCDLKLPDSVKDVADPVKDIADPVKDIADHVIDSTFVDEVHKKANVNNSISKRGSHRAGFDAFMTGYALAAYFATLEPPVNIDMKSETVESISNRIYLSGKDQPLTILKSVYAKTSKNHKSKIKKWDN